MNENYLNCKTFDTLERSSTPIVTKVPIDNMTDICQECFDFDFDGTSKFYPYEVPDSFNYVDFGVLVITGASGKGKSTLLKHFQKKCNVPVEYDCSKAIISNFSDREDAISRLNAVGLSSIPTWCKPRSVLSVGEGFRADVALNIGSNICFDEFTSTIDRMVAKSLACSIGKYIKKKKLSNVVFCSCHKDYIDYLQPDFVIDLDAERIFDCRGVELTNIHKEAVCSFVNGKLKKVGEIIL